MLELLAVGSVYRIGEFAATVDKSTSTIVRTFSGRLYGLRRYEKKLREDDLTGGAE
jgi:hypothetical protein